MIVPTASFALAESLVVVNPAGDRVHLLDPAARSVYQALALGLELDEIVAAIAGTDASTQNTNHIQARLDTLLHHWQQEGLICVPDAPETCFHAEADFRLHDLVFRIRCEDAQPAGRLCCSFIVTLLRKRKRVLRKQFSVCIKTAIQAGGLFGMAGY